MCRYCSAQSDSKKSRHRSQLQNLNEGIWTSSSLVLCGAILESKSTFRAFVERGGKKQADFPRLRARLPAGPAAVCLAAARLTGFPYHAPLPWSRTPVARPSLATSHEVRTGPRWADAKTMTCRAKRHHSSEALLHGPRNDGNPRGKTSRESATSVSARCQRLPRCARPSGSLWLAVSATLRLMPASRMTMHDSLPAVWLQTLPREILARWAAL